MVFRPSNLAEPCRPGTPESCRDALSECEIRRDKLEKKQKNLTHKDTSNEMLAIDHIHNLEAMHSWDDSPYYINKHD